MSGQKHCTSCGLPIPDGQGSSCSMCYGDIDHGRDGYYREHMEAEQRYFDNEMEECLRQQEESD